MTEGPGTGKTVGPHADVAELYDRWAGTYDTDENRTRDLAWQVLRGELAGRVVGDVVEVGCGTGRNTAWLAPRARRLVALDFSPGMLARARARVTEACFLLHDVRDGLPLTRASADVAVIVLVLEHVPDVAPVVGECARVLRPGGRLFVCELHPCRQWEGARARFTPEGSAERVELPAFVHGVSEHVEAGLGAALRLLRLGEWRDEEDAAEGRPPRLLSLLFEKAAGGEAPGAEGGRPARRPGERDR